MRRFAAPLLFAASVIAATLPREAAGTPMFVMDTDEATYTLIHRVNPQTGQLTTLGEMPAEDFMASLAAATDELLYALSYTGNLYRISVSPFGFTLVGNVGANGSVGLAYGNGALYSLDGYSGHLTRIDPATAAITDVGLIRLADDAFTVYGGDLVQGANGTWYVWTNATQALYTLDITTAVATPVPNQVQGVNWYTGLAVDYQNGGTLYGSALFTDELVATDPNSGAPMDSVPLCVNCPATHDLAAGDLASPRCSDGDGDGFYAEGGSCGPRDCNDQNAAIRPSAAEACNGVDDDCDGVVDDGAAAACDDGNACTVGDTCEAGACRTGAPRNCGLLNLIGATCRPSDGACCGRLAGGLLPRVTVCLQ
jgi:putative metal-binding protein